MRTSFGRSFSTIATILLLTLTVLGASFQMLVKDYLTENTMAGLKQDAEIIANLAAAYSLDGSLSNRDFLLNLDVASQVSDADAVIFDVDGTVVLCSDALLGCRHQLRQRQGVGLELGVGVVLQKLAHQDAERAAQHHQRQHQDQHRGGHLP